VSEAKQEAKDENMKESRKGKSLAKHEYPNICGRWRGESESSHKQIHILRTMATTERYVGEPSLSSKQKALE
jgi:hypothetical protein